MALIDAEAHFQFGNNGLKLKTQKSASDPLGFRQSQEKSLQSENQTSVEIQLYPVSIDYCKDNPGCKR